MVEPILFQKLFSPSNRAGIDVKQSHQIVVGLKSDPRCVKKSILVDWKGGSDSISVICIGEDVSGHIHVLVVVITPAASVSACRGIIIIIVVSSIFKI